MTHPNSKKVTIYRTSSFVLEAQEEKAPDFASLADKSVGPYFMKDSKVVGSGLTSPEIDLLLPMVIDFTEKDREFRKQVRYFYDNLRTPIPYNTGKEFEVGLTEDNSKPVSRDNAPIDPMSYIRFKHAAGHPFTAPSKAAAKGNSLKWFYISDPEAERAVAQKSFDERDDAQAIYLKLKKEKDSKEKIDAMLTLLNEDPRQWSTAGDRAEALRKKAETKPDKFLQAYNIDNFELRYLIRSLVNTGIFTELGGGIIMDTETKKIIGNSMTETLGAMQSDGFAPNLPIWKSKMQEALKKPFKAKQKTTA